MSSGKEGDQEQAHHSVQVEGPATPAKGTFRQLQTIPHSFPWIVTTIFNLMKVRPNATV